MGYRSLPLATAISMSIGFLLLWALLCAKLPELKEANLPSTFLKAVMMCLLEGVFIYINSKVVWTGQKLNFVKEITFTVIIGGIGFLLYFFTGYLLRYPEIEHIIKKQRNK
jgi:peptidoglycan biosynthesis protein MviN/MurJ (putative lipid II flippase)